VQSSNLSREEKLHLWLEQISLSLKESQKLLKGIEHTLNKQGTKTPAAVIAIGYGERKAVDEKLGNLKRELSDRGALVMKARLREIITIVCTQPRFSVFSSILLFSNRNNGQNANEPLCECSFTSSSDS